MSLTHVEAEYADLLEYEAAQLLEKERRFGVPGCPYGCWNGWHEIALHELGPWDHIPSDKEILFPHGLIITPCGCNCRLVWRNGRYESQIIRPYPYT